MRINEVASCLRSTYIDWDHVLVNPQFIRRGSTIAWPSFPPPFHRGAPLHSHLLDLEANRQFTFQLIDDGSLILISYHYTSDGDHLMRASLSYYGSPPHQDEALQPDAEIPPVEVTASADPPIPWLRIDYSPSAAHGPLHPICHIHLPHFSLGRVALSSIPTPRQFVEFIIALCYPDRYQAKRLDTRGQPRDMQACLALNDPSFPTLADPAHQLLIHLRLP